MADAVDPAAIIAELKAEWDALPDDQRGRFLETEGRQAKMAGLSPSAKMELYKMFRHGDEMPSDSEMAVAAAAVESMGVPSMANAMNVVRNGIKQIEADPANVEDASVRMLREGVAPMLADLGQTLGPMLANLGRLAQGAADHVEAGEPAPDMPPLAQMFQQFQAGLAGQAEAQVAADALWAAADEAANNE